MKLGRVRQVAMRAAGYTLAASLAACGGGGGGASAPATSLIPGSGATATPSSAPAGSGTFSFAILVPSTTSSASARTPKYTSPSTQSVVIALAGQSTPLATANVTPGSSGCAATNGGTSCTVTASAPAGNDTFIVTTYDSTNGTGHALSTAKVPATVTTGSTTRVPLTLNGIVSSVTVLLGASSVPVGAPAQVAVTVVAYDSGGNVIVGSGSFSPTIVLADSDTSGTTSLSTTQVTAPGTSVTLNYNGNSLAGATITPSLSGVAGTGATFAPAGTAVVTYPFPSTVMTVYGMARGPSDGNVWFGAENNGSPGLNVIAPSGAVTSYTTNLICDINAVSASGALEWFGDGCGYVGSSTVGGTITIATNYTTPCASVGYVCGDVSYMTTAPDGTVWFSDNDYGYIGTVNPVTAQVTEYDVATSNGLGCFSPEQVSVSADGTALYVTDSCGTIDRVSISGDVPQTVTQVTDPNGSPEASVVGPDGNVWFTDNYGYIGVIAAANFSSTGLTSWPAQSVLDGNALTNMVASPGGLWAVDGYDNFVWEITGLSGVTAAQGPSVIAIPAFTSANSSDPYALTVGGDGNIWTSTLSCSTPAAAKILYGASTVTTLSSKRLAAAVSRTKLNVHRPKFKRHTKK